VAPAVRWRLSACGWNIRAAPPAILEGTCRRRTLPRHCAIAKGGGSHPGEPAAGAARLSARRPGNVPRQLWDGRRDLARRPRVEAKAAQLLFERLDPRCFPETGQHFVPVDRATLVEQHALDTVLDAVVQRARARGHTFSELQDVEA